MIRKIGAAVAFAAGVLAVTGIAAPAQAAVNDNVIDTGEVVVWRDANFGGPFEDFSSAATTWPSTVVVASGVYFAGTPNLPIRNNVSSIANYDSNTSVQAITTLNNTGSVLQLLPFGQTSGSLSYAYSSLGSTFNERLVRHRPNV